MHMGRKNGEGFRALAVAIALVITICGIAPGIGTVPAYATDAQPPGQTTDGTGGLPGGGEEEPEGIDPGDEPGGEPGGPSVPGGVIEPEEPGEPGGGEIAAMADEGAADMGNGLFAAIDYDKVVYDSYGRTFITVILSGTVEKAGVYSLEISYDYEGYGGSTTEDVFVSTGPVNRTINLTLYGAAEDSDLTLGLAGFTEVRFTGTARFSIGNGLFGLVDLDNITSSSAYYDSYYGHTRTFNIPVKVTGTAAKAGLQTLSYTSPNWATLNAAVVAGAVNGSVNVNGVSLRGNANSENTIVTFDLGWFAKPQVSTLDTNVTSIYYDDTVTVKNDVSVSLNPTSGAAKVLNAPGNMALAFVRNTVIATGAALVWSIAGMAAEDGLWEYSLKEGGKVMEDSNKSYYCKSGEKDWYSVYMPRLTYTANARYTPDVRFTPFTITTENAELNGNDYNIGNGVTATVHGSPTVVYENGELALSFTMELSGNASATAIHNLTIQYGSGGDTNISREEQYKSLSLIQGSIPRMYSNFPTIKIPINVKKDTEFDFDKLSISWSLKTDVCKVRNLNNIYYYPERVNGLALTIGFDNSTIRPINISSFNEDHFNLGIVPEGTIIDLDVAAVSGSAVRAGAIKWNLMVNYEPAGGEGAFNIPKNNYKPPYDIYGKFVLDERSIVINEDTVLYLDAWFEPAKAQATKPVITLDPAAEVTAAVGSSVELKVNATAAVMPIAYKWQVNTGAGWKDVSAVKTIQSIGSNTSKLTIQNIQAVFDKYQFRCIASAGGGSATSGVSTLTVLNYFATVTPEHKAFADLVEGYASSPSQVFTVKNAGTENLTGFTAALVSGADFQITAGLGATSLAKGISTIVAAGPKLGLAAGTYTDTLRITANNGINISVPLTFTVIEPTYEALIAPTGLDFGIAEVGYSSLVAQQIVIKNTGTGTLTGLAAALEGGTGSKFQIDLDSVTATDLAPGKSVAVILKPKNGLAADDAVHTDRILITGDNDINFSVPLVFAVKEKPNNWNLVGKQDNFQFINTSSHFFPGTTRGNYTVNGDYYNALMQAAGNNSSRQQVINLINSTWGGSCFGMSSVLALVKAGELSPGFFQTGATNTFGFKYPKDSQVVTNLVNYYQVMQVTPITGQARSYYTISDLNNERIVNVMKNTSYPVVIGFNLPNGAGGHAIIGYDMTEAGSNYEIKIWDPNSSNVPSNTLVISKDYKNASFRTGNVGGNQYNPPVLKYGLTVEDKKYDYLNIQSYLTGNMAAASETKDSVLITNYWNFTIAASSGENAIIINGKKDSGDLDISDGVFLLDETDTDYLRFDVPTLPDGEKYTLTPSGAAAGSGDFETSFYYDSNADGFYSSVSSGAGGKVVFGADGTVEVDFNTTPHKATLGLTRNDVDTELFTASVTATDTGFSLAPSDDADTFAVAEFDGYVNGTLSAFAEENTAGVKLSGNYNSVQFDGVSKGKGVSITGDNDTVKLFDGEGGSLGQEDIGFSVVFITNGGTTYEALTNLESGESVQEPSPAPVKAGHTFAGWYLNEGLTAACSFPITVEENMTLYAKWTPNKYAVTYNPNGGGFTSGHEAGEKTVVRAETFGDDYAFGLSKPERAGFTFAGWNTAKDPDKGAWVYTTGEDPKVLTVSIDKAHTLFAIWEAQSAVVFLNENHSNLQDEYYGHVPLGQALSVTGKKLPVPVRTGFTFGGWFMKDASGALKTKVTDSTKFKTSEAVTVYAKWTPRKVSVTMNLNENNRNPFMKTSVKKASVNYGDPFTNLPVPSVAGERFTGWSSDAAGTMPLTGLITPAVDTKGAPVPMTVFAQYVDDGNPKNAFTAKLDPNGGFVSAASIPVAYQKAPPLLYSALAHYDLKAPDEPQRDGYEFAGWFMAKIGGAKVTAASKVTQIADHTLFARWKANKYWISFNVNDTATAYTAIAPAAKAYTFDSKYGTLPAPKRAGYVFAGWFFDAEDGGSKYDIRVDKDSIVGNITDEDGMVVEITKGFAGGSFAKALNPDAAVLYAKWEPGVYKATFSASGGHFGAATVKAVKHSVTFGEKYTVPQDPVRDGYTFTGWYTKAKGGDKIEGGVTTVELTKAATIFAQWDKN